MHNHFVHFTEVTVILLAQIVMGIVAILSGVLYKHTYIVSSCMYIVHRLKHARNESSMYTNVNTRSLRLVHILHCEVNIQTHVAMQKYNIFLLLHCVV